MTESTSKLATALSDRYRIDSHLGEGGMATVYLAYDLKHERKVAVKVLKPELVAVIGAERFLNEIRVTANLQHPHILPLYDSGNADAFLFYVMPYVDGESLRDMLEREKQLGIPEAIEIAKAIASALDYAHRHDVVHRDIKPENILIHDGQATVADFGIALAVSQAGATRLTETGLSIGTPQYMSPEQAMGDRKVDGRSDVYSLGAMLYEMLTGDPPYTGSTAQAIVAKVITEKAPSVQVTRDTVPDHVAASIQKALEKLPADRFHSAAEFADGLSDPQKAPILVTGPGTTAVDTVSGAWLQWLPWILTALLAVVLVGVLVRRPNTSDSMPGRRVEFIVRTDDPLNEVMALSKDGSRLVMSPYGTGLVVRDMAAAGTRAITGPNGDVGVSTISPDGEWVAYVNTVEHELRRVSVDGGAPITMAPVGTLFGTTWGPDNTLVYSPGITTGLWTVPVDGGTPEQLTVPDTGAAELGHWYPQFLPDGKTVLFSTRRPVLDSSTVEVLDLATRERTPLFANGEYGMFVPTGHIVFMRRETMWAVPFDVDRLQVTGPPEPVLEGVAYSQLNGRGIFSIADNGTLAYIKASEWNVDGSLIWIDRDGTEHPALGERGVYANPVISPDGNHVVLIKRVRGEQDVYVYDLVQGRMVMRVTRDLGLVQSTLWNHDGTGVVYSREQPALDLFYRDVVTRAPPVQLLAGPNDKLGGSVSPDGRELAYMLNGSSRDIWILSLDGDREARPFRDTPSNELGPVFSADGRWLAYQSDETGRMEIYLDPYPEGDADRRRQRITTDGVVGWVRWSRSGELFYADGDRMMAVPVDVASGRPGAAVELFRSPYLAGGAGFDVHPDGQRFLLVETQLRGREVTVVLNWFEELREKMGEN